MHINLNSLPGLRHLPAEKRYIFGAAFIVVSCLFSAWRFYKFYSERKTPSISLQKVDFRVNKIKDNDVHLTRRTICILIEH